MSIWLEKKENDVNVINNTLKLMFIISKILLSVWIS